MAWGFSFSKYFICSYIPKFVHGEFRALWQMMDGAVICVPADAIEG